MKKIEVIYEGQHYEVLDSYIKSLLTKAVSYPELMKSEKPEEPVEIPYPSAYLFMKATCCHFMSCKHDGECDKCEFGGIRKHAARDEDDLLHFRRVIREIGKKIKDSGEHLKSGISQDILKLISEEDDGPQGHD